jgi:ATP-dependent RNA helicase DDX3X
MRAFRSGRAPIMITTGITARGLDVASIGHVINYDLPSHMHGGITEYVHRIGRTARIGNKGKATSFYDESRDEEMAQPLVNILLESGCPVPDFFEHLIPEGGVATFEDDESDDEEAEGEQGGDAFGGAEASTDGAAAGGFAAASAWDAPPAADDSFSAAGAAPISNW